MSKMLRKCPVFLLLFVSFALGALTPEEREELKKEIKEEILEEMKKEESPKSNILDMFKISGKVKSRYSFERTARFDRSGSDDRHRGVFELKAALLFRPTDYFKAGFGFASGAETPVSSNQTMTNSASSKPIHLDLAFIEVNPYFKWMTLRTGKFKNFLYKAAGSQMVWDNDVNPEGAALNFNYKFGMLSLFGTGMIHILEEFRLDKEDPYQVVFQLGSRVDVSGFQLNAALNYSDTMNLVKKLNQSRYTEVSDYSFSYSNSIDSENKYIYDYNVLGADIDISYTAHKYFKIMGFGQLYTNLAKGVEDKFSYYYGLRISSEKCKELGDYIVEFRTRRIERDAFLDVFADGTYYNGRTGIKSYDLVLKAAIWSDVTLDFLYARQELITTGEMYKTPIDAIQINLEVKF